MNPWDNGDLKLIECGNGVLLDFSIYGSGTLTRDQAASLKEWLEQWLALQVAAHHE